MCASRGEVVPAVDVHHLRDIADGGEPYDLENLESLCHADHSRVTHAHRIGREPRDRGCDERGMPLDRSHWWRK